MGAITVTQVAPCRVRTEKEARSWYDRQFHQALNRSTEPDTGDLNTIEECQIDSDLVFSDPGEAYRALADRTRKGEAVIARLWVNQQDLINRRANLVSEETSLKANARLAIIDRDHMATCGGCGSKITAKYVLASLRCQVCGAPLGSYEDRLKIDENRVLMDQYNAVIDEVIKADGYNVELWYLVAACAT